MKEARGEHCMVCGEPLAYLGEGVSVRCSGCGKSAVSAIICPSGHYVCDTCHRPDNTLARTAGRSYLFRKSGCGTCHISPHPGRQEACASCLQHPDAAAQHKVIFTRWPGAPTSGQASPA